MARSTEFWFWGMGIFIAIPALVLAGLGVRSARLQRTERLQQIEQQQRQTAVMSDTALSAVLARIEADLLQDNSLTSDSTWFSLDASGGLVFRNDKIYFAGPEAESSESRFRIDPALAFAAEEALAAEAQGKNARARAAYERVARHAELKVWAQLAIARLRWSGRARWLADWFEALQPADRDALSPGGTPVLLLAAGEMGTDLQPFLRFTLEELRSGRWWLSFQQRQLYDAQLASRLETELDPHLAVIHAIQQAVHSVAPFRRGSPSHLIAGSPSSPLLLIVISEPGENGGWRGAAFTAARFWAFAGSVLNTVRSSVPYPLAVADSTDHIVWGDAAARAGRSFPLRAVPGWELLTGQPPATTDLYQLWLWYGLVVMLVAMLAFGLVITARTVRGEMELACAQAEFAAGVTHEFKSPITGIRLLVERIRAGRLQDLSGIRDYCAAVDQEADRLDHLVNRLLDTHRIQSGQKSYHRAPHCAAEIAEAAIAHLRTQAEAKRITIAFDSDDPVRESDLDRIAIQDAIENLLDNAIKYSPPETHIAITVRHDHRDLRITVGDQGFGIDTTDLPRIFDRFYRGRGTGTQLVAGTGLGLALVKAAVEGHGGRIETASAPGQGSEFQIRIPIRQQESYASSLNRG